MSRYELLERIGAGGMAEIFRGRSVATGGFEKPVAIKRILPHLSQDKRFVELLISEAKILSQLRHRNIVQIYDVGLADDGQYFLVMEFVEGTDLAALYEYLEEGNERLELDVALHIAAEVCEALDHAHRATDADGRPIQLVHRDVSPSNVLLSRSGEVKLTDFGIAKSIEEATGHGGVRGKFAYISPEQATNRHVDGRSDAYSLAIVLFEIVVGRRLFSGLSDFDALSAVRAGKIPRPSKLNPNISAELEGIILKALDPDPVRRYQSAAELGSTLRGFRYSMDETSGDPAKTIGWHVNSVTALDDDDARTVLVASSALDNLPRFDDEETRAISLFGDQTRSITLSTKAAPSGSYDNLEPIGEPIDGRQGDATGDATIAVPEPVVPSFSGAMTKLHALPGMPELPTSEAKTTSLKGPSAELPTFDDGGPDLGPQASRAPQFGLVTERDDPEEVRPTEEVTPLPSLGKKKKSRSKKRSTLWLLIFVALVVGAVAFAVASALMKGGDGDAMDAGIAESEFEYEPFADAGSPDAMIATDAAPAKKPRRDRKTQKRRPDKKPVKKTVKKPDKKPVKKTVKKPVKKTVKKPVKKTDKKPVKKTNKTSRPRFDDL